MTGSDGGKAMMPYARVTGILVPRPLDATGVASKSCTIASAARSAAPRSPGSSATAVPWIPGRNLGGGAESLIDAIGHAPSELAARVKADLELEGGESSRCGIPPRCADAAH